MKRQVNHSASQAKALIIALLMTGKIFLEGGGGTDPPNPPHGYKITPIGNYVSGPLPACIFEI